MDKLPFGGEDTPASIHALCCSIQQSLEGDPDVILLILAKGEVIAPAKRVCGMGTTMDAEYTIAAMKSSMLALEKSLEMTQPNRN